MLSSLTRQPFDCLTGYSVETIGEQSTEAIRPYFEHLPNDPYLEGNYRFRRFSRFQVVNDMLVHLPHSLFYQSKAYNPLLGNVQREYDELDDDLITLNSFRAAVFTFFDFCQLCSSFAEIGVHQIRITTSDHQHGNPAPEGIHQDGVDLVGVLCIYRDKVTGGETQLYPDSDGNPVFSKILNPGELLVFNDHQFFHFTTPIIPDKEGIGIRDVFVFTCPDIPFETYE